MNEVLAEMEKHHQEKMTEIRKKRAEREERRRLGIPTPPPSEPSSDSEEESGNDSKSGMSGLDNHFDSKKGPTVSKRDETTKIEVKEDDASEMKQAPASENENSAVVSTPSKDEFDALDEDERAAVASCPFVALRLTDLAPGETVSSVLYQMVADLDENDHPSTSALVKLRKRLIRENRLPPKTKKSSKRDMENPRAWDQQLEAAKSFLNRPAIEAFRQDNFEKAAELWTRTIRSFDCVLYGKSFEMDEVQRKDLHVFLNNSRCNLALAHLHLGNYKDAIFQCCKALADDPKQPKAYYRKAQAEISENNITQAIRTLNQMLEVFPGHKAALSLKARVLKEMKEQAQGTSTLMKGSLQKVFKKNAEKLSDSKAQQLWDDVKKGFDEGPAETIVALYHWLRFKLCSAQRHQSSSSSEEKKNN
eukprot:GDKK01072270.1.p1 GENE.GDKK01072270.1~~GDKK01072270.1.p1  ORF type:complete len:461 (-),score=96.22 GDKK01072270.1:60-1319(-)